MIALPVGFYASKIAATLAPSLGITNTFAVATFKTSLAVVSKTFAVSLVANKGDPLKGLSNVAKLETVIKVVENLATDFLSTKFAQAFNLSIKPETFSSHLLHNVVN